MAPSGRFDTWFEYEWFMTKVVFVLAVLSWSGKSLVEFVSGLPLGPTEFAFSLAALGLGAIVLMLWMAGKFA
jgi:hypothetical protein